MKQSPPMNPKEMEQELFKLVEKNTPEEVKKNPLFDLIKKRKIQFVLNKEVIAKHNLRAWFANYQKEARVSTGGIRGPQNVLYPWDSRFPINHLGVVLATTAKALVSQDKGKKGMHKISACEVRYNSKSYVELIARTQATYGIRTSVPKDYKTTSIWMTSFLIFMHDLDGGEYVTSSHAVSTKLATKDLNPEGSQYLPEETMEFVKKIKEILDTAEKDSFVISLSAANDSLIDFTFFDKIDGGIPLYADYLTKGVASPGNIKNIQTIKNKIVLECVGGCMHDVMESLFTHFGIEQSYEYIRQDEDSFFHGVGKSMTNPKTKAREYFDFSCDTTLPEVAATLHYEELLKDKPAGTSILLTDPDGDRLVVFQVEDKKAKKRLEKLGIFHTVVGDKLLAQFSPNQSFLLTMDYYKKRLETDGTWGSHPRFMIKTTPSSPTWNAWALKNNVSVVDVPVGFKEIAFIMKKVERQLGKNNDVVITDIYGNKLNLGKEPRLLFAGEQSGGMIVGPNELIKSKKGRSALAMREKSAGEAIIILSALIADLEGKGKSISEHLEEVYHDNELTWVFDIREDIVYYNESEQDPVRLKQQKEAGEVLRDAIDNFYLSLALAKRKGMIGIAEVKKILADVGIHCSDLQDILFVGDGVYFAFTDKFVEIRKSGTDALTRGYACGENEKECKEAIHKILHYKGKLTPLFKKHISDEFYKGAFEEGRRIYAEFVKGV